MAAAYAALVSLFNDLELILNHPRHSFSFDNNQIHSLFQSVCYLIEFMESYDNCHGPSKDAAQLLEMRITVAAQAAEQVLESRVVDQIRGGSTLGGKKRSPRFFFDLEKVTHDMEYMKRKAMKVQQERSGLELLKLQPTTAYSSSRHDPPLTSEKTSMVGFDDLLLQLLDVLTGYPRSRQVIPIVGTGGVGKTTLALNAFQHPLIVQHFHFCLWATISQQYVVQDILSTLVYYGQGKSNSSETFGNLGDKLHKRLYGRRYLIVLDDMWSVAAWDEMKFFFPDTNNGSRIVVTTRQSEVANYTSSASCLSVSLLDDDKSWDLFCEKAFVGGEGCPPELEDVGKRIVRKCGGLPLAIVVIGGHLQKSTRTEECWENVANDDMMSVLNSKENEQFLNVLSFSYHHLPVHLKPCFVYMGTFREDEVINVWKLIKRWIAEGFLKSCKGDNLEEIALDYLKDLIDRNLILGNDEDDCKIHDVLREVCLKVAEKEMFFYMVGGGVCKERRVGNRGIFVAAPPLVRSLKWARRGEHSFDLRLCRLLFKKKEGEEVNRGFLEVDLQHVNLRYLHYNLHRHNVRGLSALFLPSSISLFWNLQTLIIREYDNLLVIIAPNEIWEMIQLRHLEVNYDYGGTIQLPDPATATANANDEELIMRNLHTLCEVKNLKLSEEVCKRVPNVKELSLQYSGRPSDYCPHNLGCIRKLESLHLLILHSGAGWREFVLNLTFPNSLKKLRLLNTGVDWEEMTMMVGSLPHLESLSLEYEAVIGSEWKSVGEGKFLRLRSLSIIYCEELVNWNADSSHFPVLEQLHLYGVRRLDEFPSDIGNIPTLKSIKLKHCNVSLAISALRMVVEQEEENGNDSLKLSVYFSDAKKLEMFNKAVEEEGLTFNNLSLHKWNELGI